MRSVPPRGSGWVLVALTPAVIPVGPTRYREVVLTSWDCGMSESERDTVGPRHD